MQKRQVVAGFDCHKDTHAMCVMDMSGKVLRKLEIRADERGYAEAAHEIGDPDLCARIGAEGTSDYGAGLTAYLVSRGYKVREVLRPARTSRRRGSSKNDLADAERAARDVLSGEMTGEPKPKDGWAETLRCLTVAREHHVKASTSAMNAIKGLIVSAPEPIRAPLRGLGGEKLICACSSLETEELADTGLAFALSSLAEQWKFSKEEAKRLEDEMRSVLERNAPSMLDIRCCGALSAARLSATFGDDPERIGSDAAFSAICGACPLEASSGKVVRHRLNRGGDRQANRALHDIVRSRMRYDARTRAYVEKRTAEGKSKREIERCLVRYVAREVYKILKDPTSKRRSSIDGQMLKSERLRRGLTQREVAAELGVSHTTLSMIEREKRPCIDIRDRYAQLLTTWSELNALSI